MNFAEVSAITIPEGNVVKIISNTGVLPSEYQQVEWIKAEKDVQAYIDLGFVFDTAATIYIEQFLNTAPVWEGDAQTYIFGAANSTGVLRCMLTSPESNYVFAYGSDGSAYVASAGQYLYAGKNRIEIVFKEGDLHWKNLDTSEVASIQTANVAFTMTDNLFLLAQNYKGSPRFNGTYGHERCVGRFRYYDKNGDLICNLYPCYRKSDGVIGMYDAARGLFLTNAGNGSFTKGQNVDCVVLWRSKNKLPSEYQQVEWIENPASSGAYIDLGFAFDTAATIYINMISRQAGSGQPFGAAESSGKYRCMITQGATWTFYGSNGTAYIGQTCAAPSSAGTEVNFVYTLRPEKLFATETLSGVSSAENSSQVAYTMTRNLYLFAQNYNTAARYNGAYSVKSFKYYDKNGDLICNLYPCYRKSDGVIGMYDAARWLFLTNVGTGSFTKGADV